MSKLFTIIIILFTFFSSTAQIQHKLIVNFNAHRSDFARQNLDGFKHNFWFPSLEYLRKKDNRILSFELAKFTRRTLSDLNDPGTFNFKFKDVNTQALLRFQYQRLAKAIVKDPLVSVYPYYGFALTPHYVFTDRIPFSSNDLGSNISSVGITTHASLGLYCQFKKFFININTLWGLVQYQHIVEEPKNPPRGTSSATRKKYGRVSIIPKDNLFRIGIGLGI